MDQNHESRYRLEALFAGEENIERQLAKQQHKSNELQTLLIKENMRKIGIIKIFLTQIFGSFFQNFDPIMQPCIPRNFHVQFSSNNCHF